MMSPRERLSQLPDPDFWRGKHVFVTGHTGFKGAWLCHWLRVLGAEIQGFALAPDTTPSLCDLTDLERGMRAPRGDVRDAAALQTVLQAAAPDIVLHLAAQALVRRGYADPVGTMATNVMGTVNLLQAMRTTPSVRAAVIVTTDKCYENLEITAAYKEGDRLGGHDPYSASKACAEMVASAWRHSFPGPAIATARAGNVIGGGDWAADRLVPDCIRAFAANEPIRLRNPTATRPWQHVLEPLAGYLLLAERLWTDGAAYAEAWNFGPDGQDAPEVADIVARLARLWGEGARWEADPGAHPHEAGLLAVDASMARERLSWAPRLTLDQALAWSVDWYRRQQSGVSVTSLIAEQITQYQAIAE